MTKRLFECLPQGVALTAEGHHFSRHARQIQDSVEDALRNTSVEDLRRAVRRYVNLLKRRLGEKRLDAALLGSTHYPLVEDLFAEVMPRDVEIFSQPKVTAASLADYLARHPEFACGRESSVTFYTSTEPEHITKLAKRFLSDSSVQFEALP